MNIAIAPLDDTLVDALRHKIDTKTKPVGSLGRLEALALQLGRIQRSLTPALKRPHVVVFAGDHGAATAGISAYPQDVTWQMVENFLAGGAAINVFARQNEIALRVVDAGVAHDFGKREGLINGKIAPGTANYLERPAMSGSQRDTAMAYGRQLAHTLAEGGCNVIGFGEMGIGNTASASLITHCLTGTPLPQVIGRGTGLDDAGLDRKHMLLARALARGGVPANPLEVLAEYGGFEVAMLVGALFGAAEKRMLILVDGFIVTAALLVAHALIPAITGYCVFAHHSGEPGHAYQLKHLNAAPLLDIGLRLGEGTGAALAWPLIQAAANFLDQMASFESAGVSDKR
ncbi:nicotinate-nucleotide--dimethylbenzimidazole phosphoribosyltransferase [Nitrogeniibacter mangrovi]|uniref:Nicotinate-nucleotide--dimethylbenzimidazole phosphoribosyltransferase n=1 Tax=Nitrogeniibacter mangrovi TaxID=2016596 RepID=A0A6C1AZ72_9RHOO|nr:nicotinate-nucleotide--dimethylbenzimidazole phosphoribosyltransferase [Nitrogeniibacter mangrovi]QID16671.1 nicotinate-nucleotide--dimethylbenzimidazole phosphoribosyltransferase [Nitrogeniibacter mangrovi]